jgi:hypothetical protein
MHRLISAETPMPVGDDRFQANDIEYFNARLALLRGHPEQFLERLQHVVDMGPANDWPSPFARHLLEVLQSGRSEADVEKGAPATASDPPEAGPKAPASP